MVIRWRRPRARGLLREQRRRDLAPAAETPNPNKSGADAELRVMGRTSCVELAARSAVTGGWRRRRTAYRGCWDPVTEATGGVFRREAGAGFCSERPMERDAATEKRNCGTEREGAALHALNKICGEKPDSDSEHAEDRDLTPQIDPSSLSGCAMHVQIYIARRRGPALVLHQYGRNHQDAHGRIQSRIRRRRRPRAPSSSNTPIDRGRGPQE